jgi:hypothetical protein
MKVNPDSDPVRAEAIEILAKRFNVEPSTIALMINQGNGEKCWNR